MESPSPKSRLKAPRLLLQLTLAALAEALHIAGNILPGRIACVLWRAALRANPLHVPAAAKRAARLSTAGEPAGWDAFLAFLEAIENRRHVSASDLAIAWVPGRLLRAAALRLFWGREAAASLAGLDRMVLDCGTAAAEAQFHAQLASGRQDRAWTALRAWRSLAGPTPRLAWADAELAWESGDHDAAARAAAEMLHSGSFIRPHDSLVWTQRWLKAGRHDEARACLAWAKRWLPEDCRTWAHAARLELASGRRSEAMRFLDRAWSLAPEDPEVFLERLALRSGWPAVPAASRALSLKVEGGWTLKPGEAGTLLCTLGKPAAGLRLYALPPNGWGVAPEPRETDFDERGIARILVTARRPDRVRGGPWPVTLIAAGKDGWTSTQVRIWVPDDRPGRALVAVTEDHEIHEERGTLTATDLHGLLVDKSRSAASVAGAWTHMVEAGSVLRLLSWAAERGGAAWKALECRVRDHLAGEVAGGNDIQPHLHAFNSPRSDAFPYGLDIEGLKPSLRFLARAPELRGDWASSCQPPGLCGGERAMDRLRSVQDAVAAIESVGRLGDPDYKALLWRSGLMDYSDGSESDACWSWVALRRAGLWADSDMPKPPDPFKKAVPAFPATPGRPFAPSPGGALIQLPVAANLEGDLLMGLPALQQRAAASVAALKDSHGNLKPGVHLFTLLTHDKFINARLGGDELDLDFGRGDWAVIRGHLKAWSEAGAELLTARKAVQALIEDSSMAAPVWLEDETHVVGDAAPCVRYRVAGLAGWAGVMAAWGHESHVHIPCSIREDVLAADTFQGGRKLECELDAEAALLWFSARDRDEPVYCVFSLRRPIGPTLRSAAKAPGGGWELVFDAPALFLHARVLVRESVFGGEGIPGERAVSADGSTEYQRTELESGLGLAPLCFARAADLSIPPLRILVGR